MVPGERPPPSALERRREVGRERVRDFLEKKLQGPTRDRYLAGRRVFPAWLDQVSERDFEYETEEVQDHLLAEAAIDMFNEEATISNVGNMISGVAKRYTNRRFRVAWKSYDELRKQVPPDQAPACPEEAIWPIVVTLCLWHMWAVAGALMVCFVGVMRISEALNLTMRDVVLPDRVGMPRVAVLVLGKTKRGFEERVLLTHPAVIQWLLDYKNRFRRHAGPGDRFFPCTYSLVRSWLGKAATVMGLAHLKLRTHSMRRGGATALLLHNLDLPTIAVFGRWASQKSCTDYLRKGEVAILRLRNDLPAEMWNRLGAVARLFPHLQQLAR